MSLDPPLREALVHKLARPFKLDDPWSGHFVNGRRLRPFSLWHEYLLLEIASPLLTRGAAYHAPDIERAVSICRTLYPVADVDTRHPLRLLWHVAGGGFERNALAFFQYVDDFLVPPKYKVVPRESKGAPPAPRGRPPAILETVTGIIAMTGWDDAKVWNLPAGWARWVEARAIENEGTPLDYQDNEQRAFVQAMKDEEEAAAQKGKTDGSG